MKKLTVKEFWRSPTVVKSLHPGQSMGITDKGEPSFMVTRAGKRPRLTKIELDRRAAEICRRKGVKFNFAKALQEIKSR